MKIITKINLSKMFRDVKCATTVVAIKWIIVFIFLNPNSTDCVNHMKHISAAHL